MNECISKKVSHMADFMARTEIQVVYQEICEEFSDAGWFISVSLDNLIRVRCICYMGLHETIYEGSSRSHSVKSAYALTAIGVDFIHACMKD
jgi:hypothetical protein